MCHNDFIAIHVVPIGLQRSGKKMGKIFQVREKSRIYVICERKFDLKIQGI